MARDTVQAKEIRLYVTDKLGSSQIRTVKSDTEFELVIQLDNLSNIQADALGLSGVTALCMHVKLQSPIYYGDYGGCHRPVVGFKVLAHSKSYSEPYSAILSQITRMSEDFFAYNWPCQTQLDTLNFLPGLYRHVQARILLLGSFCVVCGCQQEQVGLKPVPCNSQACKFAYKEQGIGADLRDIYSRPVIADLFISMASAACQCITRRDSLFQSIPSNLFQIKQRQNAGPGQQIDWPCMQEVFQSLPSVAAMAKEPNLHGFFINHHIHRGLPTFQFLRWILNSCQGHLMQLQEDDRFPMMPTEYQFRLCKDSSSKEAAFSQLKGKYGSRFVFDGSPFYNWHRILQNGIKHAGCSDLASNALCRSQGIYLAEISGVSAPYCQYRDGGGNPAYPNSIFGQSPLCISLCEVINDFCTGNNGGIKVQMDPDKVIARYLFVFQSNDSLPPEVAIPSVQAASMYEICEKHARKQAAILGVLDAVKKALQVL